MRDPTNFLKFIEASVKAPNHKRDFLAGLEAVMIEEPALRRLLAPATSATTLAVDSSHLNSIMRMLLNVAELQAPLVEMLLGAIVAFADDGGGSGGGGGGGIVMDVGASSLPRLALSHLRWLDNVAINGAAIARLLVDNLEVVVRYTCSELTPRWRHIFIHLLSNLCHPVAGNARQHPL